MEKPESTLQQLMFSLIEVWKSSGQTQKVFCQEKDLAYGKFHYWYRRYQQDQVPGEENAFMAVTVKGKAADPVTGKMELIWPDGRRLVFHQGVDPLFLRSLLS